MKLQKKFYESKTVQFFIAVLAAGGLDIVDQLVRDEMISWRSVAIAIIGLSGIALRLITDTPIRR